ncbi:MAG: hypothetical protein EZS28_053980, partial [Streblomastix strix]
EKKNHKEFVAAKVIMNKDFDINEWETAGALSVDPYQISPFIVRNILAKQFDQMTVILMEYCNIGTLFDFQEKQEVQFAYSLLHPMELEFWRDQLNLIQDDEGEKLFVG